MYRDLVSGSPGLAVKGKKMPYTAMNGNMFSFLTPEGALCLRLSSTDCAAFMQTHGTEPVVQYGSVMRGYVSVPHTMLSNPEALRQLFETSVVHAKNLKAKPTKRQR